MAYQITKLYTVVGTQYNWGMSHVFHMTLQGPVASYPNYIKLEYISDNARLQDPV